MTHVSRTSIFEAVENTINIVDRIGSIAGAIIGPAAIGKTTAAEHIASSNNGMIYVRVSGAQGTLKAGCALLASALGVHSDFASAEKIWTNLEDHFAYDGSARTIILDEAQNLDGALLKEMVDIPYRFRVPVILCGNDDVLKRRRSSKGAFEQVTSRLVKRTMLWHPTEEDFKIIAIDRDVCGVAAHRACVNFGLNTSLREFVPLLDAARAFAGNGPLGLQEIERALLSLRQQDDDPLKLLRRTAA
jgi:DNA transposition AAA+ family ATPase